MIKTIMLFLFALSFFMLGAGFSSFLCGDVIVVRNQNDQCTVVDTSSGKALGTVDKRDERCHIADWRVRHPFN